MGHWHQSLVVLDPHGIQLLNNSHTTIIKGLSVLVWDVLSLSCNSHGANKRLCWTIQLKQQKQLPFRQRPRPRREENMTKSGNCPLATRRRVYAAAHLNMKIIMNMMQGCLTRCRTWPADHARWGYIGIAFPVNDQCLTQTQWDYILQFVDHINSLLDALLSREDLLNEHSTCSHCSGHQWAVWRCQDCSLATPMCRKCMRHTHQENPFHRVQCWTSTHFWAAELWEVGTYILVPHYAGQWVCDTLAIQKGYLEKFEWQKDLAEQVFISPLLWVTTDAKFGSTFFLSIWLEWWSTDPGHGQRCCNAQWICTWYGYNIPENQALPIYYIDWDPDLTAGWPLFIILTENQGVAA